MNKSDLPIIDFSAFHAGKTARRELTRKIGEAGKETGFFYLSDFGIDPRRVAEAFEQSREFFSLPAARKSEVLWDIKTNRGYDGIEAQVFTKGQPGDLKESYRFTAEPDGQINPDAAWSFLVNQPNKWPTDLPQFRAVLLPFLSDCAGLVDNILTAIEEALEMPEPLLTRHHRKRNYTMRLLHYPAVLAPAKDGQARCGEHTDWTTITLLFQGGQRGLEVRRPDGAWLPAPPLTDCVLVNIGDQLQVWTGGRLVSTPHRVRADPAAPDAGVDRHSIALFCYADFDAELDLGEARTSGEYILSKLRTTQSAGKLPDVSTAA